jgi:DNA-binding XRE family transcriptional regulator
MDLGLHQTDAAKKIGVTASTICNCESGRVTDPEIRHGPGIVSFLGYVPMERPSTLTAQLRAFRFIRGLSQRKAARKIGVDPTTWMHWELENTTPRITRPRLALQRHVQSFLESKAFMSAEPVAAKSYPQKR